jgi:uncharacterized membrane protein YvbJ
MTCRHCGAEIADKALICYRCGTATTEPVFKPSSRPRRVSSPGSLILVVSVVALGLVIILAFSIVALYSGRVPTGQSPRFLSAIAVSVAVVVIVLRAYLRRR